MVVEYQKGGSWTNDDISILQNPEEAAGTLLLHEVLS